MMAFYNEWDTFPARWLQQLVDAGHLPPGVVDARSIEDVSSADLEGATEAHFFAGIGGWPLALRNAGWPATRPVWTASLPCQPFSIAGKQAGTADDRHLWPVFRALVAECRPPVIFGEQVASPLGRDWLAGVRSDLEALGYAVGAADLCAAGVGAPHIRQRLYWCASLLADANGKDQSGRGVQRPGEGQGAGDGATRERPAGLRATGSMANTDGAEWRAGDNTGAITDREASERHEGSDRTGECCAASLLADADRSRRSKRSETAKATGYGRPAGAEGWSGAYWHECLDGKARRIPTEPELFPLADGVSGRVGQLRAYGNAIVPQVAAQFVTAFMEAVQ